MFVTVWYQYLVKVSNLPRCKLYYASGFFAYKFGSWSVHGFSSVFLVARHGLLEFKFVDNVFTPGSA